MGQILVHFQFVHEVRYAAAHVHGMSPASGKSSHYAGVSAMFIAHLAAVLQEVLPLKHSTRQGRPRVVLTHRAVLTEL
jgi:hypothetical protein